MHDTAAVAMMSARIKWLERIIEEHLGVREQEWDDVGFGTVTVCPICKAEAASIASAVLEHDPSCYWAEERE